jgi:ribose 5-phosphate isomerase B
VAETEEGEGCLMLIALASDHNGVRLKEAIKHELESADFHFVDLGPWSSEPVDYVDVANQLCSVVINGDCDRGVLVCGTGVGMSIVANRMPGIRAGLVHNEFTAQKCREHNDTNVLCLGAWASSVQENIWYTDIWLKQEFGEGRHVRRVEKIDHDPSRIVMANGVFDILHTGHIAMLRWAKSLGSWLVVAINSDRATRQLKGWGRPINEEDDRKAVLENLRFVDEVIIFDDVSTAGVIDMIKPSVVVKGAQWSAEDIRIRDRIPNTVDIKVFPTIPNRSTTHLIQRIRA